MRFHAAAIALVFTGWAPAASAFELIVTEDGACPNAAALVEKLQGRGIATSALPALQIHLTWSNDGQRRMADLRFTDAGRLTGEQRLLSLALDCAPLGSAVVTALTVAISDEQTRAPRRPLIAAAGPLATSATSRTSTWALGIVFEQGYAPALLLGVALSGQLPVSKRWSLGVAARGFIPGQTRYRSGAFDNSGFVVQANTCVGIFTWLSGCALAEGGALLTWGVSAPIVGWSKPAFYFGAGPKVEATLPVLAWLQLQLGLALPVALNSVSIDVGSDSVWRRPAAGVFVQIAVLFKESSIKTPLSPQ